MKINKEQSALVCNESGCYKLQDILQNPDNKCDSKECKALETEYSKYMHLGIPVGYYHSKTMYVPEENYQERSGNEVSAVMMIDEKIYSSLIDPSFDNDKEMKKSSKKITKSGKKPKSSKKTTKKKK